MYPQESIDFDYDEYQKFMNGEDSLITYGNTFCEHTGTSSFFYEGKEYVADYSGSKFFEIVPIEFIVVEEYDDDSVILFAKQTIFPIESYYNGIYDESFCPDPNDNYLLSSVINSNKLEESLETAVTIIDSNGDVIRTADYYMWAPSSAEIEEWAEVLGEDIKKSDVTSLAVSFGHEEYVLRDGGYVNENNYYCSKVVNRNGDIVEYEFCSVDDDKDYIQGYSIRPVTRIAAQFEYKGF